MAVTTRVQPRYVFRMVAIAVVSIALGVWGVLDYAVWIPQEELAYRRGQVVCQQVSEAIVTARTEGVDPDKVREEMTEAVEVLNEELKQLYALGLSEEEGERPTPQQFLETIKERNEAQWLGIVLLFREGLVRAARPDLSEEDEQVVDLALTTANSGVRQTSEISRPGELDRYVKGLLFVPCLPIGLLMLWPVYRASRKQYVLEDDGTLRTPQGDLTREEIADIDMKRWMSKSVAYVESSDGRRIKLDDYLHKNIDLIVGTLASERYPDDWTVEARPKTAEAASAEELEPLPGEADQPAA